jgi:hypothetical protein
VIVNCAAAVWLAMSVTVIVTADTPAAPVGVPVIDEPTIASPSGNVPVVTANECGATPPLTLVPRS